MNAVLEAAAWVAGALLIAALLAASFGWTRPRKYPWATEPPLPPEPAVCMAGHTHRDLVDMFACPQDMALRTTRETVSSFIPGQACPYCNRNHFADRDDCPGHRVTDGRTGEVVGYWKPKPKPEGERT